MITIGFRMLDAIVLAEGPAATAKVLGLSLAERGRRVAARAGAGRVLVVGEREGRADIEAWRDPAADLLVIRAGDQVVHTPLVAPLVERGAELAVAVGPDGAYAGALLARGAAAAEVAAALAAGEDDRALAARLAPRAAAVEHGAIARHPATTPAERRAAARHLYRIVHKPQDNAITRYLYRPVSAPLTRLFLRTPITPNQISYLTAAIVAIGLWLTARGSMRDAILGTAIVLAGSYVDCCDGEVARLKLRSSRFGAWLDTVIDELSSLGYMIALGWHCHLWFGPDHLGELGVDPWLAGIAVGVVTYAITIYVIYYNLIVVVGSANSQDYVGRFEIVDGQLRPAVAEPIDTRAMHPVLRVVATYAPYIVRRDFISLGTLVLALLHLTHVAFAILVLGGVVTAAIVTVDHVRLRRQRRSLRR